MKVGMAAMKNREEVGAASVDYLMYSGYACLAYFWADMARVAAEAGGRHQEGFYKAKLQAARFYTHPAAYPYPCGRYAVRRRQPDGDGRGRFRPRLLIGCC